MEILTNIWALVLVLGVIIFVHEFGHFITAKAFGMRVYIFSFGFGRRLLGFKWGDTDCRLSLIPLGGYVKLEGEPEDHLSEDVPSSGDGQDFVARPRWQRFLVYIAGPLMNGVLTVCVLTALYTIGVAESGHLYDRPTIGILEPGSPGALAGLSPGDEILSINGKDQKTWKEAQFSILSQPDSDLTLRIRKGLGEERDVPLHSGVLPAEHVGTIGVFPLVRIGAFVPNGVAESAGLKIGDGILQVDSQAIQSFEQVRDIVLASAGKSLLFHIYRDGQLIQIPVVPVDSGAGDGPRIGIAPRIMELKFGPIEALQRACQRSWEMTGQIMDGLYRLLSGTISLKTMSGPIGIARVSGDAARGGAVSLLAIVAFISLNIGLLNLFPLAPLDGGHLAILLLEAVIRRDLSLTVKSWIINAGASVLFLLMGIVIYSDLSKTSLLGKYLP